MEEGQSLYELLGLEEEEALGKASAAEIRRAYQRRLLELHPDKQQSSSSSSGLQEGFLAVQQAWEVLRDEGRRAQYDEQRRAFRRKNRVHVTEQIEAEAMELLPDQGGEEGSLFWPCRCGGRYVLAPADVDLGISIIGCSNCSFFVEVLF